jgi:hypothetical protein
MAELPDELPQDQFLATMPWWVVLGSERGEGAPEEGRPGYLVLDADGSTCLAVFTDEDLALRFVEDVGFDGGPLPVATPGQFLLLASRLPDVCQYAAFDPPARVGARARWVVPLTEVSRALAAARAETGEECGVGN